MKKLIILLMLLFATSAYAVDNTKTAGVLMTWTLLDDTGGTPTVETSALTSGSSMDSAVVTYLHIDVCHANSAAADASSAGVVILIKSGTTDETWHEYLRIGATTTTANSADCDATSASGGTDIQVASTTNFETPGDTFFFKDNGTLANSCLITTSGYVDNDCVHSMDALVNSYDSEDWLFDVVDTWNPAIPSSVSAVKCLFWNNDADCNYACRVRYTMVTDVE